MTLVKLPLHFLVHTHQLFLVHAHQLFHDGAFNADPAMSTPTLPSNFSGSAATLLLRAASEGGPKTKIGKPAAVKATPKTAANILMKLSRTNTRKTKSKHKRRDRDRHGQD